MRASAVVWSSTETPNQTFTGGKSLDPSMSNPRGTACPRPSAATWSSLQSSRSQRSGAVMYRCIRSGRFVSTW